MLTIIAIIVLLTVIYYLVQLNYQYWEKRGIRGPKPTFLVGNLGKNFLLKQHLGELYTEFYRDYDKESVVGIFRSFTPVLIIRDPDLVKEVTTKSFGHFRDNDLIDIDQNTDPIFGKSPFFLKGEEWKTVRAQLTPGFTSGKMKWLYPYLENNSEQMVKFLENDKGATQGEGYEAKELGTRFTLNNVGDAVFGIDAKCFEEDNSEFRQLSTDLLTPGIWSLIVVFASLIFPIISKTIPVRFSPKKIERKLINIVTQTLEHREKNNIVRNDFLHILNQLKNSSKDGEFTVVDITAHAAGFFVDGSDSSSTVMSYLLFHLSVNPEVQLKLREELRKAFEENEDKLPYEVLQSLPYLDAVLNESLRISPPFHFVPKQCTETFNMTLKDTNKSLLVEKGQSIIIPSCGIQNDPQYFEDPDIFRPERFLGENKEKIRRNTFMPFGEGPRACLGQRFATLQIKVGVSYIIKNYELSLNGKTKLPLKVEPSSLFLSPIGGLWIDFKKLN